jgi:hypothetical protein
VELSTAYIKLFPVHTHAGDNPDMPRSNVRANYTQPFVRTIPPLFQPGGLCYTPANLGARIAFMVNMPQEQISVRMWQACYDSAVRALADAIFYQERGPTAAELTQLDWLKHSGHFVYAKDERPPRMNWEKLILDLERSNRHLQLEVSKLNRVVETICNTKRKCK